MTDAGRATYTTRNWISEASHRWIKEVLGFLRFSVRGQWKVQGEWDLVCLALNVKRLRTLMTTYLRSPTMKTATYGFPGEPFVTVSPSSRRFSVEMVRSR